MLSFIYLFSPSLFYRLQKKRPPPSPEKISSDGPLPKMPKTGSHPRSENTNPEQLPIPMETESTGWKGAAEDNMANATNLNGLSGGPQPSTPVRLLDFVYTTLVTKDAHGQRVANNSFTNELEKMLRHQCRGWPQLSKDGCTPGEFYDHLKAVLGSHGHMEYVNID